MNTSVTLKTFREKTAYHWEFHADEWITVTDEGGAPLWQFKRGAPFLFQNTQLPRIPWTKFKRPRRIAVNLDLLRAHPVVVLTLRGEDKFLARLPQ